MWITATTTTKVTQKEYDDDDNNNKQQKKKKNKKKKNYDEETLTEPKWTSWVIMRFAICVCVIITIYYFNKNIHIKYINDVYTSHITFGRLCTVFWCSWLLCCSVRFFFSSFFLIIIFFFLFWFVVLCTYILFSCFCFHFGHIVRAGRSLSLSYSRFVYSIGHCTCTYSLFPKGKETRKCIGWSGNDRWRNGVCTA